jgi:hypothetical protein
MTADFRNSDIVTFEGSDGLALLVSMPASVHDPEDVPKGFPHVGCAECFPLALVWTCGELRWVKVSDLRPYPA